METNELKKILDLGVKREIKAYEFYRDVAAKMKDETVVKVFKQLAGEELQHRETLEKLEASPTTAVQFKAPPVDYKLAEQTEAPDPTTDMKPADAIALAMKKEQEAVEFYRKLSAGTDNAEVKGVFDNLANMELGHKNRLENVFVDIGYPEVF